MILKRFFFIFLIISIKLLSLEMRIQSENQLDRKISWIHLPHRNIQVWIW